MHPKLVEFWKAALLSSEFSREQLEKFDFSQVLKELSEFSRNYTLPVEGQVLYGLSQIVEQNVKYLNIDAIDAEFSARSTFREQFAQQFERHNVVDDENDDLLSQIPDSLLDFNKTHTSDLSADLIIRSGDNQDDNQNGQDNNDQEQNADNNNMDDSLIAEQLPREDPDLAALDELDFDFENELGQGGGDDYDGIDADNDNGPGDLDFGPDLDYSSSAPHTPQHTEAEVDFINDRPSPVARKTKKIRKSAIVDDEIDITRRSKLPLREVPTYTGANTHVDVGVDDITLNPAISKLLDPGFIKEVMKANRLSQSQSSYSPTDDNNANELNGDDDIMEDNELGYGGDDYDGMDIDPEDFSDFTFEDTPQQLTETMRQAQSNLQSALEESNEVHFNSIALDGKLRACTLMELLVQSSQHKVVTRQPEPWKDILISRA